jgi:hypothetical protein
LQPGPHDVGFRLVTEYDHSRREAPAVDFEGKRNPAPLAMAMPVAIWYPATRSRSSAPMQYGTFAALSAKRTDLTPVTPADRATAIENLRAFAGFAFGRQLSESVTRDLDTTATAAVRDAPPASGRFPVILAATDGSIATATVLFEYLASHGFVVMAVPSRRSYATLQVSRPASVVEARVRDLEFLLDHARRYAFADTARIAVIGVNFDGMSALSFQMKNMVARAVVSLDGWEGKQNGVETVRSGMHYDPRRLRTPYFVVLQDESGAPADMGLDRTGFDQFRYSERQWLVLRSMSHSYLIGNPLAYSDVPPDRRLAYELLVRSIHRFFAAALDDPPKSLTAHATAEGAGGPTSSLVKDAVLTRALPAVPDDAELERLIMVDRAVDKVADILRTARASDSSFVLFPQQTMALYAFRFTRQNNSPFALRLLALNAEAFPRSWNAADALGDGYRDAGDTTRARAAYTRALDLIGRLPAADLAAAAKDRETIEQKRAGLR